MPLRPTLMEEIRDLLGAGIKHKGGIVSALLMRGEDGEIYYSALFGVYILPVLCIWGFYKLM